MARKIFTEEELHTLRQNPYIYSVTETRISLTKEFKEIFLAAYKSGESPRKILADHGFDRDIIGERRIWSISQHIRAEYKQYGCFHDGYAPRRQAMEDTTTADGKDLSTTAEISRLRHEVDYLKQEMEFLKKIASLKTSRK